MTLRKCEGVFHLARTHDDPAAREWARGKQPANAERARFRASLTAEDRSQIEERIEQLVHDNPTLSLTNDWTRRFQSKCLTNTIFWETSSLDGCHCTCAPRSDLHRRDQVSARHCVAPFQNAPMLQRRNALWDSTQTHLGQGAYRSKDTEANRMLQPPMALRPPTIVREPTYPIHGVVTPEILPPQARQAPLPVVSRDDHLNAIATILDDRFCIPGTRIRFGLDALIGWIPGIGDALAGLASCLIIFAAWQRGVARITLVRMLLNVAIENTFGAIPIIGDAAHVAWKCNRRNYNLLVRERQGPRRHTWQDWVFVLVLLLIIAALFLGPLILLVHLLRSRGIVN